MGAARLGVGEVGKVVKRWARFGVGEKTTLESGKVGALLRRRLRWLLRWRLWLRWRGLVVDVQVRECQQGIGRFVDSEPVHHDLNVLHVVGLLQKVQGCLMLVNDWVRFSVGEQLLHQLADVVQSGDVVGDIAHGWLAEVWAYGETPSVFGCNEGRAGSE